MKNNFLYFILVLVICSCSKQKADLIVFNSNTYIVNEKFETAKAFAVKDGKFIAVGTNQEIQEAFKSKTVIDAKNQTIVPGFIDAHCHFYRMGLQQQKVSLEDTKSYDEVLEKIVAFQKEKNVTFISGRGWDQNDWDLKEFPTKEKLDRLFPTTPVAVGRVDGHALLVNQAAIDIAGITKDTKVSGGEIILVNGEMSGVLIDAAMDFIKFPEPTKEESIQGLLDAQKICFSYGLTTVDDAGLDRSTIELIDEMQKSNELKMRVYAMISGDNQEQIDYYINKGITKTDRLNVRSFKIYGDGALGSRGAAMREPYSDRENHFGALIYPPERYQEIAKQIVASDFQMNTHAIGDSTNTWLLKTYKEVLKNEKNRRWRIEHAQIISSKDFQNFDNILPSVQPTHATSDMYWAEERIGKDRMKGAYAYKNLLNRYGKIALGTDFPVEKVNPFLTFYAAAARRDLNNFPEDGFQMENALTREQTLKGMTIWAAFSNFEEDEKGSIEVGKFADFVILDQDIMEVYGSEIPKTKVVSTYLNGEKVY
ncbi:MULTISPECIES: amidohydrolase [unclassified Polaribacter]|uniref:amidohydrolase n=1 Tax=unclassified Polaribacter TaxID=196858 RepID=UPI0011BEC974|nr:MULTISPECIES: amidohydrolase [unclassified Polaribacter]TXD53321.1 amidohydrolase [Polaribacter sp. IC063]TXD57172.1 amidohydrolase [Polaribacter sp. IC066]